VPRVATPIRRASASAGSAAPRCLEARNAAPAAPSPFQPAEPRSYTPAHLAARILTGRGALEGERKQVTVLWPAVYRPRPALLRRQLMRPQHVHRHRLKPAKICLDPIRVIL